MEPHGQKPDGDVWLCVLPEKCCGTLPMSPTPPELELPSDVWNEYLSKVIELRSKLLPTNCCSWCLYETFSQYCGFCACFFEAKAQDKLDKGLKGFNKKLAPHGVEGRYDISGCCTRGRLNFHKVEVIETKTLNEQAKEAVQSGVDSAKSAANGMAAKLGAKMQR
ncbi:unnamed protein product [Heterosigma akashiwo]